MSIRDEYEEIRDWLKDMPKSLYVYFLSNVALAAFGLIIYILTVHDPIGGALFASGVVGIIYLFYHRIEHKYKQLAQIMEDWGLKEIHKDRKNEQRYRNELENCSEKLHIQAATLSRFRRDLSDKVKDLSDNGVEIRFLLLNPDSEAARKYNEENPDLDATDLSKKIQESARKWLELEIENLTIKYYDDWPVNYFRIDDRCFVGPYFSHKASANTVTFFARTRGNIVDEYKENFEKLWEANEELTLDE